MSISMAARRDPNQKRVREVLDYATQIYGRVRHREQIPKTLPSELLAFINRTFPLPASVTLTDASSQLDQLGSDLWNATTNVVHETNEEDSSCTAAERKDHDKLLALLRYFAFLLLDAAQKQTTHKSKEDDCLIRIFKVALKTARACLEKDQLDLAQRTLERASDYSSKVEVQFPAIRLGTKSETESNRDRILKSLVTEYHLLRVMHCWRSGRLDVSSHFVSKISADTLRSSPEVAEKAAELYYAISKDELACTNLEEASRWIGLAYDTLDCLDKDALTRDAVSLRLSVVQIQVRVLLAQNPEEQKKRAWNLIDQLALMQEFRGSAVICRMRLEVITSVSPVNIQELSDLLQGMVSSVRLTEKSFRSVMRIIHRARKHDLKAACLALYVMATGRLRDSQTNGEASSFTRDWLEKCMVTYTHFITSSESVGELALYQQLNSLLDFLQQSSMQPFTTKATHAAQTLLWKATSSVESDVVVVICGVLRHPMYDQAGDFNKARIARKAMLVALHRDDLLAAREAFFQIPDKEKDDSNSRYLGFKLGLRSQDFDFACESLHILAKSSKDNNLLFACVMEAQQSGYRRMAVKTLQAVADASPSGVNPATLLRSTARLLMTELEEQPDDFDAIVHEIANIFEHATTSIGARPERLNDQSKPEILWWAKNSYNTALNICSKAHPAALWRILNMCIKFVDCLFDNTGSTSDGEFLQWKLQCQFLVCGAVIVLARAESDQDTMKTCYEECRQAIQLFMRLRAQIETRDRDKDLEQRAFELLKLDLECVLRLEQWNAIDSAMQACLDVQLVDKWEALADLVIIIYNRSKAVNSEIAKSSKIPMILQRAIDNTWKQQQDVSKVTRWIRIAFTIGLESENGTSLSLQLLREAHSIAKKQSEGLRQGRYPQSELHWLATTAFNQAVDYLADGDQATSELWFDGATELAYYSDDGGSLHNNLCRTLKMARETIEQSE